MAGSESRWLDPWPSPQVAFADSPWTMIGRVLTAWFDLPFDVAARVLSPSLHGSELRTRAGQGVPARLRFYDVAYRCPVGDAAGPLRVGHFREAVVALGASVGEINGEASLFMWTDSDPYRAWGREVFGFPLLPGAFDLSGDLWSGRVRAGSTGAAAARVATGVLSLTGVRVTQAIDPPRSRGPWLTPRLVHRRGGLSPADRELLVVRPAVTEVGRWFGASADIAIRMDPGHPLGSLLISAATADVVDGIELLVPDEVTVL